MELRSPFSRRGAEALRVILRQASVASVGAFDQTGAGGKVTRWPGMMDEAAWTPASAPDSETTQRGRAIRTRLNALLRNVDENPELLDALEDVLARFSHR